MTSSPSYNLRTFYILIITQTLSLIGSRISSLAVGIWIFQDTGNVTPLALVGFFAVAPMVLASSLAGVLADRWDRRIVMVLSDAGQAVGTVLLLISFLSGDFQLWHLYVITAFQAVFGVFQGPAFQASVTMLIPDNHRDRANAIQQLTGPMAGIAAPTLAAVVYAAFDVEGAILVDLATFVIAMIVVFSVHIPRPTQTEAGLAMKGTVLREMLGGMRFIWDRRLLIVIMIYVALLNFLANSVSVLNTPYILARTGNNEAALGVILSITNIGAIVGGIAIGIWGGTRPRMYTILPSIIIFGAYLALVGMSQTVFTLALTSFMVMLPLPIGNALFISILQAKVPPDIQGRVFAVVSQISMLLIPVSFLIIGPLADNVFERAVGQAGWDVVAPLVGTSVGSGMGLMYVIGGLMIVGITVVVLAIPATREMESRLPDYTPVVVSTEDATQESIDAPAPTSETATLPNPTL
ncbi:MAG: MFS transporter [Chloroflexota bacterium]